MEEISNTFKGVHVNEIGPHLWTSVINTVDNKTLDLKVLSSQYFYPAKSFEISKLWTVSERNENHWRTFIKNSFMVHFYGSQTNSLLVQRRIQHEAYAFLGMQYGTKLLAKSAGFLPSLFVDLLLPPVTFQPFF